jgi:hypothetical protein
MAQSDDGSEMITEMITDYRRHKQEKDFKEGLKLKNHLASGEASSFL